ncbi:phosphatase PAP2 family protein [Aliiroseovarius sp.]|uniref:phosphatase PAP2 family protein n=1 Tax=Aliiroseovarius sp. TaxID=1872442 RepID=UPI003BACC964
MLSHALEMTRDAVIGPWTPGKYPITPSPFVTNDLKYLSGTRRFQTRLGALSGRFRVTSGAGGAAGATLALDGDTILTLEQPTDPQLQSQLPMLDAYSDLRLDRIGEIQIQLDDILSFYGAMSQLDSDRRKHSLQLLVLVQSLCVQLEMQVKHYCHGKRPVDFDLGIQPVIQTPDHSTFPSGHATEAYALATVMHRMQTDQDAATGVGANALPFRIAHRIAANRTVAGVHYPVDSAAGAVLGIVIAEAVLALCTGTKASNAALNWNNLPASPASAGARDFTPATLKAGLGLGQLGGVSDVEPLVAPLWTAATGEW